MSDVVSWMTHVAMGQAGRTFWGPGDMCAFLVTGEESGGAMFALDCLVGAGGGPRRTGNWPRTSCSPSPRGASSSPPTPRRA